MTSDPDDLDGIIEEELEEDEVDSYEEDEEIWEEEEED
jgi:hypothetical protein